jgi:hypothetical protein
MTNNWTNDAHNSSPRSTNINNQPHADARGALGLLTVLHGK